MMQVKGPIAAPVFQILFFYPVLTFCLQSSIETTLQPTVKFLLHWTIPYVCKEIIKR